MIATAKLRYVLATHGRTLRTLGTVLLVLGTLGAVATLVTPPPTMTVTEVTDTATIETGTTTSATVEGEHVLYDDGEVLTDEPVYIRSVTPNISVTATTHAPQEVVDVEQRLSIVYEASSSADGVFRDRSDPLPTTTDRTEERRLIVNTTATIEIAEIARAIDAIRNEIGDAGRVDAFLHVETAYTGPDYEGTLDDRVPISVSADAVRIPTLDLAEEHRTTTTVRTPDPTKVFTVTVPELGDVVVPHRTLLFGVLAVLGGLAIGAGRYGRGVSVDRGAVAIHRLRYDEWISVGELSAMLAAHRIVVPMASLEGLVDVAIDSDTRVVHDPSEDCYAVLTAGALYVFAPETSPESEPAATTDD